VAKPARVVIVVAAAIAGAYAGLWIAHLAGWSGDARWPLDPRGGAGTVALVFALATIALLATGVRLNIIPVFTYRKVATEGTQTIATIVETWRTGAASHDMGEVLSEYGLKLRVLPPTGTPYQARTKTMVAIEDEAAYRPGALLEVRYHETTPRKVFVVGPIPVDPKSG